MSYRKLTLEQRVSKLERILKLEQDREYYNSYDDVKSIPTLVARSLDSDDEIYFLCEFPATLRNLKDLIINMLLDENYDDLDDLCKRNYIRWFDLLEDRWRFEYADEYCKRNDCDPELFGGEDAFLFIDDDKTAAPLDIIDVVEDHFG